MSIWKRFFGNSVTTEQKAEPKGQPVSSLEIPDARSCMNSITIPWYWHGRPLSNEELAHMACKEVLEETQKEFSHEKFDRLEITPMKDQQYAFVKLFAVCSDGMAKTMEARIRTRFAPKSMQSASQPTSGPVQLTATFAGEVELETFTFRLKR